MEQPASAAGPEDADGVVVREAGIVPGLVVLERFQPPVANRLQAEGGAEAGLEAWIEALRATGRYVYVEPDYVVTLDQTPGDLALVDGTLWGLRNTGQKGGVPGVDIDVERAWTVSTGSRDIVVAVIDTGIRYTHRALAANMWRNPGEIPGNGVDDDGNGYIDDIHGIDAVTGSGDPMDTHGHGTHVAGTIGADPGEGSSMVGVAPTVSLMALKFVPDLGGGMGYTSDAIECIDYAVRHGARIINASWGHTRRAQGLHDAIAGALEAGVLFVASAGNDGADNDLLPQYPAGYALENIISVTGIDRFGRLAAQANEGAASVDLAAPGEEIFSAWASSDDAYLVADGTSSAAAHVSGVAALVMAAEPDLDLSGVKDRILRGVTRLPTLAGRCATGGLVSAHGAMNVRGDGALEIEVLPRPGSTLYRERQNRVAVHVTDGVAVQGAGVLFSAGAAGQVVLRDDGQGADFAAGDGWYSGWVTPVDQGDVLNATVSAAAAGKVSASKPVLFALADAPLNDHFADSRVFSGVGLSALVFNSGATIEPGEPTIAGRQGGASLWWSWTPSETTEVTMDTRGSTIETLLGVYTGSSIDTLSVVAENADATRGAMHSLVRFTAQAGTTYHIVVDGEDGEEGLIHLTITTGVRPKNDDFADASALTGEVASATGNLGNATAEIGEPDHKIPGDPTPVGSIWWTWTAPRRATAEFRASGGDGDQLNVFVYAGSGLEALTLLPPRPADWQDRSEAVATVAVQAGVTYHVAVVARQTQVDLPVTLRVSLHDAPGNDRFADRIVIAETTSVVMGDNAWATLEPGEPPFAVDRTGASVWWTWLAPSDGTLEVDGRQGTAAMALGIYTGDSVEALMPVGRGHPHTGGENGRFVSAHVEAGTTYHIVADTVSGWTGAFPIVVRLLDTPPNDDFANRVPIQGTRVSVGGTTVGATAEPGEPRHFSDSSGRSVWWTWTAPREGTAFLNLTGGGGITAYTGAGPGALYPVEDSRSEPSRAVLRVEAGTTYHLAVDAFEYKTGPLRLDLELVARPENDDFAGRQNVSGEAVLVEADNRAATAEPGETAPDGGSPGATLWWTWTAPGDGVLAVGSVAGGASVYFDVFTGDSLPELTPVEPVPGDTSGTAGTTLYPVRTGDVVQIRARPSSLTEFGLGEFVLDLRFLPQVDNDHFADRRVVTGESVRLLGRNAGATFEEGEPLPPHPPVEFASVWWTWTAPRRGTLVIDPTNIASNANIGVFTGDDVARLTEVARTNIARPMNQVISLHVEEGTSYHIQVMGHDAGAGMIDLQMQLLDTPENDDFASRTTLTGRNPVLTADTSGATRESQEPLHGGFDNGNTGSLWWVWTAPEDGKAVVLTTGSGIPHGVGVYTGDDIAELHRVTGGWTPQGGDGVRQVFEAVAGTSYLIGIEGMNNRFGVVHLSIGLVEPPANDQRLAAAVLEGREASVTATMVGSHIEPNEPDPGFGALEGSVWWRWVAPGDGRAAIAIENA
ncbi:MAG: hypothetical protein D6781_13835, partial [Verrucomicrobia bacterium]